MTKMREVSWHQRPRSNRLASILYPQLADEQAKREMDFYAKQEGKRSPLDRGGSGSVKPVKRR